MKTILTLALSAALVTTGFAQTNAEREEAKRIILGEKRESTSYPKTGDDRTVYGGDRRNPERYPSYPASYPSSRERQVYEINRAYDAKIYSIRQNRTLSRTEKARIIRQLESERRRALDRINDRYYENNRRYDRDDCEKDKKNKKNNGNRYGWERGKGNPHRGK